MKNKNVLIIIALFTILISLPFLIAAWAGHPNYIFGGFLLNPTDGNSYLAKMYQGWLGHWAAVLPFTAEPGKAIYLFTYYLFLGHVARWTNLTLPATYFLARVIGALALLVSLARFYRRYLGDGKKANLALLLAAFGSGIGWLALPFGKFTSDFWVAETYPLLSSIANPHFPLSLALMLWLLTDDDDAKTIRGGLLNLIIAFFLAMLQPFGIVIVLMALGGKVIWDLWNTHQLAWKKIFWVLLGGVPLMVYQLWATLSNPIWAEWNAQNQTIAPPVWDLVLSLSPALILAGVGIYAMIKSKNKPMRLLISWMVFSILLIYFPFNLQRRFMLGLFIPVAGLAVAGAYYLLETRPGRYRWLPRLLFIFSCGTNLIAIMAVALAIQTHQPLLYLSKGEAEAFTWMKQNTSQDALVLGASDTGNFIPAYTGRRVIYGHAFETANAAVEKQLVDGFFSGKLDEPQDDQLITSQKVDYIFFGPREASLGKPPILAQFSIIYQTDGVTLYKVKSNP